MPPFPARTTGAIRATTLAGTDAGARLLAFEVRIEVAGAGHAQGAGVWTLEAAAARRLLEQLQRGLADIGDAPPG